jgi:drug/metabolite transporter (DMT)-like permease
VADLSLLGRLQPVLIAIVAPMVLGRGERVDPRVWLLLAAGMAGTGVLLGPQLAVGNVYGLWAMGAVVCSGIAHTSLRVLGRTESSETVVLWFQVGVTVLALSAVLLTTGALPRLPSPTMIPWLAGVGVAGTAGQVLMTRAYALDRAAIVSAASHTSPVWAVLADALLFSVLPGTTTLVGGVILVTAALALVLMPAREAEPESS